MKAKLRDRPAVRLDDMTPEERKRRLKAVNWALLRCRAWNKRRKEKT